MAAFPSNPKPNYPIDETPVEPEVLVSKHRDGSEQRRLKGAGVRRQFRLTFGNSSPATQAQMTTLLAHWTGENGTLNAFTVRAWDGDLASASALQVKVTVAAVSDAHLGVAKAAREEVKRNHRFAALLVSHDPFRGFQKRECGSIHHRS